MNQDDAGFEDFREGRLIRSQKGMTLVELLAVIVILGIIAAVAVPMVSNIIQDSKDKATVNEALNIIYAAKLAYTYNSEVFEKTENDITVKLEDLIKYGYINATGYNGAKVVKSEKGWFITSNPRTRSAVNNLVSDENYIQGADYLYEEKLQAALEGKKVSN